MHTIHTVHTIHTLQDNKGTYKTKKDHTIAYKALKYSTRPLRMMKQDYTRPKRPFKTIQDHTTQYKRVQNYTIPYNSIQHHSRL